MTGGKVAGVNRRLLHRREKLTEPFVRLYWDQYDNYSFCNIYRYLGLKQECQTETSKKLIYCDFQNDSIVHVTYPMESMWGNEQGGWL